MIDLNEVWNSLEIDQYKEWYTLGLVHYGDLYLRMETYYLVVFDQ